MAKAKEFDIQQPISLDADEDEATVAAIDEAIRDAKAGRTVAGEEVRKLLQSGLPALLHQKSAKRSG